MGLIASFSSVYFISSLNKELLDYNHANIFI